MLHTFFVFLFCSGGQRAKRPARERSFQVRVAEQHRVISAYSSLKFGEWAKPILMPASPKGWRRTEQVCGPRAIAPKQLCCPFGFCFVWFDCWDVVPNPTKGVAFGNHELLKESWIENKFSIRSLLFLPIKDWAKFPAATEQSSADQKLYFVS